MRMFLIRDQPDPVGRVAEVVTLESGKVVVGWLPQSAGHSDVDVYDSLAEATDALMPDRSVAWLEPASFGVARR